MLTQKSQKMKKITQVENKRWKLAQAIETEIESWKQYNPLRKLEGEKGRKNS